ncbi:hypothetical protein MMC22_001486 [Lobaria immixta]|nr:hypothetical protein [Lobaria immixta]
MGTAPNTVPLYLIESGHPDRIIVVRDDGLDDEEYEARVVKRDGQKKKTILYELDETKDEDADGEDKSDSRDETMPQDSYEYESFDSRQLVSSTADRRQLSASQFSTASTYDQGASNPIHGNTSVPIRRNKAPTYIRNNTASLARNDKAPVSRKRKGVQKSKLHVEIDSNSDNERSKKKARKVQRGKSRSLAEAIVECKKIDARIRHREYEQSERRSARCHEENERQRARRHDQNIEKAKATNLRLQLQLELMKRGRKPDFQLLD